MPKGYIVGEYNTSEKFEPYATNGQPFPWLLPFLPSNIRPNRYTILIHPNLTTFEVKGMKIRKNLQTEILFLYFLFPSPSFFHCHFPGQVFIEFYVEKEMSFIVLHAQNLNITEKVS